MIPGKFYYKKELTPQELSQTVEVAEAVVCFPKQTKFGPVLPSFWDFFKFLRIPVFTVGPYNYNALSFSTQVPARVSYAVEFPVTIKEDYWNKCYLPVEINPKYFQIFTPLDFMFFDCLINFNKIGDGYFNSTEAVIKGFRVRKAEVEKQGGQVQWNLIVQEALLVNPLLQKFIPELLP